MSKENLNCNSRFLYISHLSHIQYVLTLQNVAMDYHTLQNAHHGKAPWEYYNFKTLVNKRLFSGKTDHTWSKIFQNWITKLAEATPRRCTCQVEGYYDTTSHSFSENITHLLSYTPDHQINHTQLHIHTHIWKYKITITQQLYNNIIFLSKQHTF